MKKIIALLLALCMVFALCACAATETETKTEEKTETKTEEKTETKTEEKTETKTEETEEFDPSQITLTFSTLLINHPVLRCCELGFKEACEALGYKYTIVGTEGMDYNEVMSAAEAACAAGSKAVAFFATDYTAVAGMANIKDTYGVYTANMHMKWDEEESKLDMCKACDNIAYAKGAAEFFAEQLDGKTGKVAIAQASMNAENEAQASAAFAERFAELQAEGKATGITLLAPFEEGATDVATTTDADAAVIQANPDLVGAISWTGNGPVTWSNAARKCGKQPGDLCIVAMDYTADNLAEIAAGYATAIIAQPLYDQAYKIVEGFDTLLRGGSVEFWEELEAPVVYNGGEGVHDPATYTGILDRVAAAFGA